MKSALMENSYSESEAAASRPLLTDIRFDAAVVGVLRDISEDGAPLVDFPNNPFASSIVARAAVKVGKSQIGLSAVLLFEQGDPSKPIVMNLLVEPVTDMPRIVTAESQTQHIQMSIDGRRLTLSAQKEIVLQCGKASITLTSAGKVIIRGTYVVSRSSGVNKIKGGSVQIN